MTRLLLVLLVLQCLLLDALHAADSRVFGNNETSPQVVCSSGASSSVTGTVTETTLATCPVRGGLLGPNGSLRITVLFSFTNSANNKTFNIKFGGQAFHTVTTTTNATGVIMVTIRNANATNAQIGQNIVSTGVGYASPAVVAGAVDTAVTQNVTITGTLANTGETITVRGFTVEFLPGVN